jgi:uncharacterized DUF497 family protein
MRFTWDEGKRQHVLEERGIDLLRAALIFDGPTIEYEDARHDYGETRIVATGEYKGEYFTVVYTRRGDALHIITAWRTGRGARDRYQKRVAGRPEGDGPKR